MNGGVCVDILVMPPIQFSFQLFHFYSGKGGLQPLWAPKSAPVIVIMKFSVKEKDIRKRLSQVCQGIKFTCDHSGGRKYKSLQHMHNQLQEIALNNQCNKMYYYYCHAGYTSNIKGNKIFLCKKEFCGEPVPPGSVFPGKLRQEDVA